MAADLNDLAAFAAVAQAADFVTPRGQAASPRRA
jgi:hypothetical protein